MKITDVAVKYVKCVLPFIVSKIFYVVDILCCCYCCSSVIHVSY